MSILHKCCCGGEEIPMSLTHEIVYGGLVDEYFNDKTQERTPVVTEYNFK